MAPENRNEETTDGNDGAVRRRPTPPAPPAPPPTSAAPGAADGRPPLDNGGAPASVPAQRAGRPTTPPSAPPFDTAPPLQPPSVPPQAAPPRAPLPAAPSDDPSATGRNGGSRTKAPAAPPAAPRGRDAADGSYPGRGPGYGDNGEREAHALGGPVSGDGREPAAVDGGGAAGRLLDDAERDRLGQRLHHVLATFVDTPRASVAEAAEVLAEAEQQLMASLRDRQVALRAGWQDNGDPDGPGPDTEQLRLTLRTYREVTERLLRM